MLDDAGFRDISACEFRGDVALVDEIAKAVKYLDKPVLLVIAASAT